MAVVKDWRGTPIKVGAVVVYPSRQGSSLWMSEGVVVSVESERVGVRRAGPGRNRIAYPKTERLTVMS